MATTLEEVQANIRAAVEPGYRQRLLARGQARGMVWRGGQLPIDAPNFSPNLSEDLLSYGYSLLLHGLRYLDLGGEFSQARVAFEVAAESLEAVVAQGQVDEDRDFHRLVAGAAYHLGQFSARAFSLLHTGLVEANLETSELCLARLMLRDLEGVNTDVAAWFSSGLGSDDALIAALTAEEAAAAEVGSARATDEVLTRALESNFLAAMSQTLLALEHGDVALIDAAQARLREGQSVAGELSLVTQWWTHRLAVQIVGGLWASSFHARLPNYGPPGVYTGDWAGLRKVFIASLMRRRRAEIELWPSQMDAAERVLDYDTSLVLSLPTSAGKTRIAELCVLACLAQGRRVVFVTPLRALSAQTEVSLRRTFAPLGKTVSSLYGSIGTSATDVEALQTENILVSTPEKLDFALRNDPDLLQDIGLIVLDEGHMIGLGEREVRYEAQIQRLLRRPDAHTRRIVCLSAILPDGEQLTDFTNWLTFDHGGGLIKNNWRPTRLRYGEVDWNSDSKTAQLNIVVGDEHPFVPKFLVGKKATTRKNAKVHPSSQTELCIFTAWRLMDDGQSVLIFCPLRASVIPFARGIIEMHKKGLVSSVLSQPVATLSAALAVGEEWFGPDHDILKCLRIGVAVHHGELPTPFRKEIEKLLRDGVLRLTVSSPTLAQGLNLAATSLVFHGHMRRGSSIEESEFRNVVGRAGRAYVDLEGLVVYPMFDDHDSRRAAWANLVGGAGGREMESGILKLVETLLLRMARKHGTANVETLLEYVAGQAAWDFPELPGEWTRTAEEARSSWPGYVTSLDTAIFSLLEDGDIAADQVEAKLDEVLTSSLFARRLQRQTSWIKDALLGGLKARARLIWANTTPAQRRGYFLAGVGLATGQALDEKAELLEDLLATANAAVDNADEDAAVQAIVGFAAIAFEIPPFVPKNLPANWRVVLEMWLRGVAVPEIDAGETDEVVSLIEHAFVYNLPWAMEAVRVRADAHLEPDPYDDDLGDLVSTGGSAVAAVETGTFLKAAQTLIKGGFASRLGAIAAVSLTGATFDSPASMRTWLRLPEIESRRDDFDWPTDDSHELWKEFTAPHGAGLLSAWKATSYTGPVKWSGIPPAPGTALRLGGGPGRERSIYTSDFNYLGEVLYNVNAAATGLTVAVSTGAADSLAFEYIGPDDLLPKAG
ncbi:MAG: DEAD/DEAH box helicase [Curvibacter sp.]|nr:MAG: DEAD/DEAH box helicase [Curvibacter sp.]